MITHLIVPGLNGSGPGHWQTWIETRLLNATRVHQHDWSTADLGLWSARIRNAIARQPGKVRILAHSFGVLAAVQAAEDHSHRIAGALLVAPADPERFGASGLLPSKPLGFPALVVASANDPWMSAPRASWLAGTWGADIVNLGPVGHVNIASGHGPWPQIFTLLNRLSELERGTLERGTTAVAGADRSAAAWVRPLAA